MHASLILWYLKFYQFALIRKDPKNGFAPLRFYTPFPHLPLRRPRNSASKPQSSVIVCCLLKHRGLFGFVLRHPRPSWQDSLGVDSGRLNLRRSLQPSSGLNPFVLSRNWRCFQHERLNLPFYPHYICHTFHYKALFKLTKIFNLYIFCFSINILFQYSWNYLFFQTSNHIKKVLLIKPHVNDALFCLFVFLLNVIFI